MISILEAARRVRPLTSADLWACTALAPWYPESMEIQPCDCTAQNPRSRTLMFRCKMCNHALLPTLHPSVLLWIGQPFLHFKRMVSLALCGTNSAYLSCL